MPYGSVAVLFATIAKEGYSLRQDHHLLRCLHLEGGIKPRPYRSSNENALLLMSQIKPKVLCHCAAKNQNNVLGTVA